jgi:hypothetical protein
MKAFREGREEFVDMQAEHDEPAYNGCGQRLRPHYCVHGVANMWADYDDICRYCEDGISTPVQWGMIRLWQYIRNKRLIEKSIEREKRIKEGVENLSFGTRQVL